MSLDRSILDSRIPKIELVSVILPCRNEELFIGKCLESVLAQELHGIELEIIVADGASTDRTREIVQQMALRDPRIRLVHNPGQIVSSGLNVALRIARGETIVRMDAHTEYANDYVAQCWRALKEGDADNVGGPWVAVGRSSVGRAIAAAFQSPFAVGGARGHDIDYEGLVDTVYLGSWRRSTFERYGVFDEELVRNQDDEHNLRIVRGGGKVWQTPRIRSIYYPRESLGALFRQYMQYGYWKVRVIQKHRVPASWRHLVPGCFILGLACGPVLSGSLWVAFGDRDGWVEALLQGMGLSSAWAWIGLVWCFGIASYLLALWCAAIHAAGKSGWDLLLRLPLVFACYHFGYGLGFLMGVRDFAIRRKSPREKYARLTR